AVDQLRAGRPVGAVPPRIVDLPELERLLGRLRERFDDIGGLTAHVAALGHGARGVVEVEYHGLGRRHGVVVENVRGRVVFVQDGAVLTTGRDRLADRRGPRALTTGAVVAPELLTGNTDPDSLPELPDVTYRFVRTDDVLSFGTAPDPYDVLRGPAGPVVHDRSTGDAWDERINGVRPAREVYEQGGWGVGQIHGIAPRYGEPPTSAASAARVMPETYAVEDVVGALLENQAPEIRALGPQLADALLGLITGSGAANPDRTDLVRLWSDDGVGVELTGAGGGYVVNLRLTPDLGSNASFFKFSDEVPDPAPPGHVEFEWADYDRQYVAGSATSTSWGTAVHP
ncbi:MAG: hypothetical protein ACRCZP_18550, partial [Phycicoccus sp.]